MGRLVDIDDVVEEFKNVMFFVADENEFFTAEKFVNWDDIPTARCPWCSELLEEVEQ